MLFALIIGLVVGAVMGLTGAGGGIIAVPALVEAMGWQMQQAMPVALLAVTAGALVGAVEGFRKKLVRYRAAIIMALVGMPLTSAGVLVAHQLSQTWLMAVFAGILLVVAVRLINGSAPVTAPTSNAPALLCINTATGRFDWTLTTSVVIASIGGVAGFITGLLGVGGGFVIVPMLRRYTNVSMHGAVATSLLVIALVGSAGVGSAVLHGAVIPLEFTAFFMVSSALGMLAGRQIARHLREDTIQRAFAALLVLVALNFAYRVATV
ncbi:sulfite exporter TauE/SafE family protein [Undibacterium sp. Jales W-56]|uniref:sulfite exporter TauE/SafE family protein n=1 Tax=Undibacterium sp. Jales W-56 TaxID=2897325 RepID=UPI0021D18BC6|nr:sulfite exporter TauE/SafE family protein [Undibacterium sp. Jales W-56]MCU6435675.1 sulfite exporter TauE/SafE family protein [Undibacterium sp. Jales W-56]